MAFRNALTSVKNIRVSFARTSTSVSGGKVTRVCWCLAMHAESFVLQ